MADLGSIGVIADAAIPVPLYPYSGAVRKIVNTSVIGPALDMAMILSPSPTAPTLAVQVSPFAGLDYNVFNSAAPSLKIQRGPEAPFRILWPVVAGSRSFSIACMYRTTEYGQAPAFNKGSLVTTDFPRLRVRANVPVGINSDTFVTATTGFDGTFRTLTYSFTALAKGVVEVWLEHPAVRLDIQVYWDDISVS